MHHPKSPPPDGQWVVRRAKLFEAGEYPDKGLTITAHHLAELERGFSEPVPLLIEHAHSPLALGFLTGVSAQGDELFGEIQLSPEADALLRSQKASALSIGLTRDFKQIREVSLVSSPRIPGAQLFTAEWPAEDWQTRYEELVAQQRERQIRDWIAEGRLVPAQAGFARALLRSPGELEFDGESVPVVQLLIAMIERQPIHTLFHEQVPISPAPQAGLNPEAEAFYRRYFPDLAPADIAKHRAS